MQVFVVVKYWGTYEDSCERNIKAFYTKLEAETFISEQEPESIDGHPVQYAIDELELM